MKLDEFFMERALVLARRGGSAVAPNPMVGAVLVQEGKIIAEAWHKKFGGPHAEKILFQRALKNGTSLRGATLYLTLEPCVAFLGKKTPPCAPEVVRSGIARAVIAIDDPNPSVRGKGIRELRRAGVKVALGCLAEKAARLNPPFIAMKAAMSLDGKIATRTGDSKWITSEASRKFVKRLRDKFDAILVGKGTVIRDDPELSGEKREPLRIVLDSSLALSEDARVLRNKNALLVTTRRAPSAKIQQFENRGVSLKIFPKKIALKPLLRSLQERGIRSVLVEGGSEIFGSFTDEKLVHRLYWFIAPKIIGGREAKPAVSGVGARLLKQALPLCSFGVRRVGADILIVVNVEQRN